VALFAAAFLAIRGSILQEMQNQATQQGPTRKTRIVSW